MKFDELWQTLPIPFGYQTCTTREQNQWKALVEAAFKTGLFDGAHKSASAKTADSKRISDLEAAVAEIRAAIFARAQIEFTIDNAATIKALKAELRNINRALSDPRVDLTMTASEVIKELRSALKVIHTWASFPESFDFEQTKRLCMSALGREE
jgi:hypothetical protein